MADVIVAESKIHGLGVCATRGFSEDEIILVIDDTRVVDDEHPLRPELGEYSYHCDYLAGGKTVLMRSPAATSIRVAIPTDGSKRSMVLDMSSRADRLSLVRNSRTTILLTVTAGSFGNVVAVVNVVAEQ